MRKKNLAILIFDDVEVLDFAGPFEVFSVTNELNNYELLNVYTVAPAAGSINAKNGLSVNPDHDYKSCPDPDILIVPGGAGTRPLLRMPDLLAWVKAHATQKDMTLSVCTGSLVLGAAGLLDGLEAVTHHENLDDLQRVAPEVVVKSDERFTDNGAVLTAGGISAGIDMSLHVVERLYGAEVADRTRIYMEYGDWRQRL